MSVSLSYKGSTISTSSVEGSKTLNTEGKFCEGNILMNADIFPTSDELSALPPSRITSGSCGSTTCTGTLISVESVLYLVVRFGNSSTSYTFSYIDENGDEIIFTPIQPVGYTFLEAHIPIMPKKMFQMTTIKVTNGSSTYTVQDCIGRYIRAVLGSSTGIALKHLCASLYWYCIHSIEYFGE